MFFVLLLFRFLFWTLVLLVRQLNTFWIYMKRCWQIGEAETYELSEVKLDSHILQVINYYANHQINVSSFNNTHTVDFIMVLSIYLCTYLHDWWIVLTTLWWSRRSLLLNRLTKTQGLDGKLLLILVSQISR